MLPNGHFGEDLHRFSSGTVQSVPWGRRPWGVYWVNQLPDCYKGTLSNFGLIACCSDAKVEELDVAPLDRAFACLIGNLICQSTLGGRDVAKSSCRRRERPRMA